ncbi:MAG TPA: murein biosynthesis integral membrane protein MurJ [Patescibacteria group bacterium]|nr:murein biosynthesis integral membrane protein MurJ [Patescibacteria group bacterium]
MGNIFKKGLSILLKKQSNILSAAFVIATTIIISQILGLIRQRLLVSIFGASDTLGIYLASSRLPDFLFQVIIAGALSSAFIPIFSEYLGKEKYEEANRLGSSLLSLGLFLFLILGVILFVFANQFSMLVAPGFSKTQIDLMAYLTRIIIAGELLFIIGSFFSAVLQSYNHFFIPGIASALYNLGIILGIKFLSPIFGVASAAYGVVLGASIFALIQLPLVRRVGFSFKPVISFKERGVMEVFKLMVPRTLSIGVFQLGTLLIVTLISFLPSPGRSYVIFDYAQTLAFAPVVLFGQAIAQAAFPVLAREKDRLSDFKTTFITSFNQMLYLVLPISVLFLILRIPIVRLIYGASQFDWPATVLTGRTLAFFSISIFAQSLSYLIARGFYALHDTKTPLIVGTVTTIFMLLMGALFIFVNHMGVESIAIAFSIATIANIFISFAFLDRKVGGFDKRTLFLSLGKIATATAFTGLALYVPIKLLDQLVFDTTKTINLLFLTGIASFAGLSLYLFLTWLFNVKEATIFLFLFRKVGDWRQVLGKSEEAIDGTRLNP